MLLMSSSHEKLKLVYLQLCAHIFPLLASVVEPNVHPSDVAQLSE